MKKETKLEELERRIRELESWRHYEYTGSKPIPQPYYPYYPLQPNPNLHYHGNTRCWNNPCVWF